MHRLAIAVVTACSSSEPPPRAPPPVVVEVATLAAAEVVDATEYLANLRPVTSASIQPQVGGQLVKIFVHSGDRVERGQPLVQIDPGRAPASVAQAEASRAARKAALELAEQNLARSEKLVAEGAVPRQELDDARAALDSARGEVAALGAQVASNQVELRYYRVLAPSRGVVGDIPVRIGQSVTTLTRLTSVTDNSVLEANVAVPVERARAITPATRIDLLDDTSRRIGTGNAKFVSPQVDPETQAVLVKADIDNARGELRAEQVARGRVVWSVRQGLRVPALAVTRLGGQAFVYVAQQQGPRQVAKQRPVKLGDLVDNQYVVLDGLRPGERIAVSNVQKLRDGAAIQINGQIKG